VYSRRQFCADIQVRSPQELLWNPRLREAATTLWASLADSVSGQYPQPTNYNFNLEVVPDTN